MKYEVTQGQYADFLNLLDPTVAMTYYPNAYQSFGHTITFTNGEYHADAPDRACNYLNCDKMLDYFDWSGLRPITELEYEKACRGPRDPVVNEFTWGTTSYNTITGIAGIEGSGSETALPVNANCHVDDDYMNRPVRAGIFATGSSDREKAGASYYGVMEMTGNLLEFVVSVARPEGRMFRDQTGDGNEYNALPDSWYPPTGARAYMGRGWHFGWDANILQGRTSDRTYSDSYNLFSGNSSVTGCRGGRTIP